MKQDIIMAIVYGILLLLWHMPLPFTSHLLSIQYSVHVTTCDGVNLFGLKLLAVCLVQICHVPSIWHDLTSVGMSQTCQTRTECSTVFQIHVR